MSKGIPKLRNLMFILFKESVSWDGDPGYPEKPGKEEREVKRLEVSIRDQALSD